MILFASLLLPVVLIGYYLKNKDKTIIPSVFIGFVAAVLVCVFKMFFVYSHRVISYNFGSNFAFYLLRQTLLPVILVYGIFFAFSKDTIEYRSKKCFPLLTSFYMVYFPYSIVSSSEGLYSFYPLFVKPFVFLMMIIVFSVCIKNIFSFLAEKKFVLMGLYILIAIFYLLIPAVFDSLYIIDTDIFIMSISSIIYCVLPIVYFIFRKK